jgi:hypothetical protein
MSPVNGTQMFESAVTRLTYAVRDVLVVRHVVLKPG